MNTPSTTNQATLRAEPQVSLPGGRLVSVIVVISAGIIAGFALAGLFGPWGLAVLWSGVAGVGVVALFALVGVWMIQPRTRRDVSTWMAWWMGLTVFRILFTPVAAWVLYSAASSALETRAFALAVGLAYLATVVAEALVVSQHLRTSSAA